MVFSGLHKAFSLLSSAVSSPPRWWILGLAVLTIVPVALLITTSEFDGLYGQDPYAYYNYAVGPLRENLLALKPPPPFFWPPGYPLLVALVSLLVGVKPLAGQLVSLVAGGLVAVFTAMLAKEVWDQEVNSWLVPGVAGLLAGLMGQLWQSSAVVMADTSALALATLGVWALVRYGRRVKSAANPRFGWLGLAAVSVSYAVLSRWAYALVAIPCTLYALWCLFHQRRGQAILYALGAAMLTVVVLWPVLVPVSEFVFTPQGDPSGFVGDLEVYSWNPITALHRVHQSPDGILEYRLPNGLYYALAPAHRFYFTPILAPLLLPGLWAFLRRRSFQDGFLLLGWIAVVYLFHSGAPWQNFRFTLAYLPPMAIIAALGFESLTKHLKLKYHWFLRLLFITGLGWMGYGGWTLTQQFIDRKNAHLETMRWVESQLPPDAQLITFGITLTFEQYSQIEVHDIFLLSSQDLVRLLEKGRPIYLLLNLDNIGSQWVGKSPYENYRWLQEVPGLIPLGKHGDYDLFKVQNRPPPLIMRLQSPL